MNEASMLTVNDIAQKLGLKRGYVYQNYQRLGIPYYQIGNLLRFDPAEIDEWLKKRRNDGDRQPRSYQCRTPNPSLGSAKSFPSRATS